MAIANPTVNVNDYLVDDDADVTPKHGTTVQAGWGAADALLKPKAQSGDYPTDFKISEETQLIRFLEDAPFMSYESHWVEREGKKSFVCLGVECPLCHIAYLKPRGKFAFNIIVISDETPTVQVLTASSTLARQLRAANDDPRRGPLTKHCWSISRQGTGPQTTYTLERVRATDLAEEWDIDIDDVNEMVANAIPYDSSVVRMSTRQELMDVAKAVA